MLETWYVGSCLSKRSLERTVRAECTFRRLTKVTGTHQAPRSGLLLLRGNLRHLIDTGWPARFMLCNLPSLAR
jgi:hypothetical protein